MGHLYQLLVASVITSLATALPTRFPRQRLLFNRGRLLRHNEFAHAEDEYDFENQDTEDAEYPDLEEKLEPSIDMSPKRHPRFRIHTSSNEDNGTERNVTTIRITIGNRTYVLQGRPVDESKGDSIEPHIVRRGRKAGTPVRTRKSRKRLRQKFGAPRARGTLVSTSGNDPRYDSLLLDLPEYAYSESGEDFVVYPDMETPIEVTTRKTTFLTTATTATTISTELPMTATTEPCITTTELPTMTNPPPTTKSTPKPTITTTTLKPPNITLTSRATSVSVASAMQVLDFLYDDDNVKPSTQSPTSQTATGKKDIREVNGRPEAKTKLVVYRGLTMNLENGKIVFTFYGIPYAIPPVDKFRFKPPLPAQPPPGNSPFEANHLNAPCFPSRLGRSSTSAVVIQQNEGKNNNGHHRSNLDSMTVASEDCLYLNIWLPHKVVEDEHPAKPTLYPVLVWIHGEGFLSGMEQEDYKSAAHFVAETDIIMITIQYRLGVFGFLHMSSTEFTGNMGLQDQVEALKWIEDNIECFGGDRHAVTIMGHDIGAALAGFHLVSNFSPGYFNRAVMIGGVPLQPHVFQTRHRANEMAMEFARQLGCAKSFSKLKPTIECLLSVDPLTIWEIQILMLQQGRNTLAFPFVPTEDGTVLSDPPAKLIESGKGKTCQVLIGGSSNPGSIVLVNSVNGMSPHEPMFVSYDRFLTIMRRILYDFSDLEMDAILHQYKNWRDLMDGYANQIKVADALGDFYFTSPLRKFSDLWSARGLTTYHFSFAQQSTAKNRSSWMGAVHGDELDFFFGVPLQFPEKFSREDKTLSSHMMKILENFIKAGKPNSEWERYGKETPHFTEFGESSSYHDSLSRPRYGPRLEQCAFWNDLFPKLAASVGSIENNGSYSPGINGHYNPSDFETTGRVDVPNNGSLHSGFSVDENCYIELHNCSRSNFAIYVNES